MPTLFSSKFGGRIDLHLIMKQYKQLSTRDTNVTHVFAKAIRFFKKGESLYEEQKYDEALKAFSEARIIVSNSGLNEFEAACFAYIASAATTRGFNDMAIQAFDGVLQKTQSMELRLSTHNQLSILYLTKNESEKVVEHCLKIMDMVQTIDGPEAKNYYYAAATYNIGEAYVRDREYDKAKPYILKSLEHFRKISYRGEVAKCQATLGIILANEEMFKEAVTHLVSALSVFEEMGNKEEEAETRRFLGLAYAGLKKLDAGICELRKSLSIFQSLGSSEMIKITLRELSRLENLR